MDKIKVLEEIGLKRVSDETHIEQKYIKYMVDCDFEKLNRINTLGFVKILSKAYKIDLSDWSEAFEEYWVDNHKDDENQGLFIVVDDKVKSRKLLIFILLVMFIATFGILFSLFQDKINLDDYINQNETSFEQSSIVEDTQKTLEERNTSIAEEKSALDEEVLKDVNQTEVIEVVDEVNVTKPEEVKKVKEVQKVLNEVTQSEVTEQVSPRFEQEAIISPNSKLWVGLIYLDNKKRRSYLGEGNFSIDTSREQIITTGHGSFNLTQNGKTKEFKKQAPMRFLVKDNNITEIDWVQFKKLNEGKSW